MISADLADPLVHGPPEQGNYSSPPSTLAPGLTKHFNLHRQKQNRFSFLSPHFFQFSFFFFFQKALSGHVSTDFFLGVLQKNFSVLLLQNLAKIPPAHPLHLSAPLLIILLFVFSFPPNVLFILFRVSPGTLQNWI